MCPHADLDPAMLFAFALREHDWVLADLIAVVISDRPAGIPALRRLSIVLATEPSAPDSLPGLRTLAFLSHGLGLDR